MVPTGDRLINRVRDDTDMMSFYKAELPTEPDGWEESTIHEGLGGPDAHSDRFWRKGPYGIEQDSDGGFEAYVIVADTPFKVADGFSSFEEAVNHLTSQMGERKVGDSEEDARKEGLAHLGVDPEVIEGSDDGDEDDDTDTDDEKVEKSLDGEIALGPEANSVGKSEDFEKSLDGADTSEGTHKEVTPPHPEDVNEKHYIDNHALGSARLKSHSPSLEAFERSVGGFRELMASKNSSESKMYCDSGETVPFVKADESTTYAELEDFQKAIHGSRIPEKVFTGKNRIGGTETNPNRGPSKKLAQNRHARETKEGAVVGKGDVGRDLYDRRGWKARSGSAAQEDYGKWKSNQPVSEYEGENISRGPAAQSHWDKSEERYRDPERQKEHADRLLGRGKWDHSYDEPKKDTTGYGRKTPNQAKGTKPNQKGESVKKSDDESFEKAPYTKPTVERDSSNPFGDAEKFNPGVAGQRADDASGMSAGEFVGENMARDETFRGVQDDRPLSEKVIPYVDIYDRTMKAPTPVDYGFDLPDNHRNSGGTIDMREHQLPKRAEDFARQMMDIYMRTNPDLSGEAYNTMYRDAYEAAQRVVMKDALIDRIWNNYRREGWTPEDEDQAYRELLDDPYRVGTGMVGPRMMEGIYNDIGRSVYGDPDKEGNDPLTPYNQVYVDTGEQTWISPALRRREAATRLDREKADADERRMKEKEGIARRIELDRENQAKKDYLDDLKAGRPGEKALESAQDRNLGLQAKKQNEDAYRQQMEDKMTPKQPEQPEQPKKKKERWSKERKDAARAQREAQSQQTPSEPEKADTEPTQKSWDTKLVETPFRDMLSFERSKRDEKKGIAVGTMAELKGAEMQGSHPIRELYRTVQMGEGKDWNLSSPYDPKVHKTDSESKKL